VGTLARIASVKQHTMAYQSTPSEIRNNRIKVLGKEFGPLYDSIYNEFVWLSIKWEEYKELYGKKESRIGILNQAAPHFFYMIEQVLWENILLGLCKLTDPPKMRNKKNATSRAIVNFIDNDVLKKNIELKINELMESTEFCRDWRNRNIAHKDLLLATDKNATPLQIANRKKLNIAFSIFQEIINLIEEYYFKSTTIFDMINIHTGSVSLLYVLDEGIESRKHRMERIKSGDFDDSDIRRRSL
jgi:hypothetical protein